MFKNVLVLLILVYICTGLASAQEFKVTGVETAKEFTGIFIVSFSSPLKADNEELKNFFRIRRPFSYDLVIKKIGNKVVLIDPSPNNLLGSSSFELVISKDLTSAGSKELDREYRYDFDSRANTFKEMPCKKQNKIISQQKTKKKKINLTMSPQ